VRRLKEADGRFTIKECLHRNELREDDFVKDLEWTLDKKRIETAFIAWNDQI
jgi:hypothetical protein